MTVFHPIGSCVSHLLFLSCPAHIEWPTIQTTLKAFTTRIVSVVVDSVNGHPARPISNVLNKIKPLNSSSLTHPDPSSAVVFEYLAVWIGASLIDLRPRPGQRCFPNP